MEIHRSEGLCQLSVVEMGNAREFGKTMHNFVQYTKFCLLSPGSKSWKLVSAFVIIILLSTVGSLLGSLPDNIHKHGCTCICCLSMFLVLLCKVPLVLAVKLILRAPYILCWSVLICCNFLSLSSGVSAASLSLISCNLISLSGVSTANFVAF